MEPTAQLAQRVLAVPQAQLAQPGIRVLPAPLERVRPVQLEQLVLLALKELPAPVVATSSSAATLKTRATASSSVWAAFPARLRRPCSRFWRPAARSPLCTAPCRR